MSRVRGPARGDGRPRVRARARRRRSSSVVRRESALPADLLRCEEPMVEAAVIDAAARVFLGQLGQQGLIEPPAAHDLFERDGNATRDREAPGSGPIDTTALDACLRYFRNLPDEPPPDLLRGLDHERLWVLVDLVCHGSGLGRQRATLELRQYMRQLRQRADDDRDLLGELASKLAGTVRGSGFPVVLRALQVEASAGLRRLDGRPA